MAVDNDPDKISFSPEESCLSPSRSWTTSSPGTSPGRLWFTTDLQEAELADVHFVCVGTPQSRDSLAADVSAVHDVTRRLAGFSTRDCLIVGKSTVPVGTTEWCPRRWPRAPRDPG